MVCAMLHTFVAQYYSERSCILSMILQRVHQSHHQWGIGWCYAWLPRQYSCKYATCTIHAGMGSWHHYKLLNSMTYKIHIL